MTTTEHPLFDVKYAYVGKAFGDGEFYLDEPGVALESVWHVYKDIAWQMRVSRKTGREIQDRIARRLKLSTAIHDAHLVGSLVDEPDEDLARAMQDDAFYVRLSAQSYAKPRVAEFARLHTLPIVAEFGQVGMLVSGQTDMVGVVEPSTGLELYRAEPTIHPDVRPIPYLR